METFFMGRDNLLLLRVTNTRLKAFLCLLALAALAMPICGQETAEEWLEKGRTLFNEGKYDEGVLAIEEVIRLDPDGALAWTGKGLVLLRQRNYTEAIRFFDEAIKLDPGIAMAWNNKGLALYAQGNYTEAIQAFEETIRLDPEYAGAWNNKGLALYAQGNYTEAIQAFDEAIRLDSNNTGAWALKGSILAEQGNYTEAIQAYDEAIRLDPEFALAWNGKGLALYNQGNYTGAIQCYDEAIRLDPEDAWPWKEKGNALLKLKRYSEADSAFAEAGSDTVCDGDVRYQYEVTDDTWMDAGIDEEGEGFRVYTILDAGMVTQNIYVEAFGTVTVDVYEDYPNGKVMTKTFQVTDDDYYCTTYPTEGRVLRYISPRISNSEIKLGGEPERFDIIINFETENGYTFTEDDYIYI